jgi:hypothetical protein
MIRPVIGKFGCYLTCGRIKEANLAKRVLAYEVAAILGDFQITMKFMYK